MRRFWICWGTKPGGAGRRSTCGACTLVRLTLAKGEVPVPVALRLFLPEAWASDPERCRKAGVPEERRAPRSKMEIALDALDRVMAAGVVFGCVRADAGYGMSAEFRRALSERGLRWAVGIPRIQKVYPTDVELLAPPPPKAKGRAPKHPVPTRERESAEAVLEGVEWKEVSWREGTKGALRARFAAVRVRVADGPMNSRAQHLPGEEAWLLGEHRATGEKKYYLANHPPGTPLETLAAAIKARWSCEQAHQQMKEELGLDHFEGRSWSGLHHHALLTMIAFGFLQHLRLQEAAARGGNPVPRTGAAAPAHTAGGPSHTARAPHAQVPAPLPTLPPSLDPACSPARSGEVVPNQIRIDRDPVE